MEMQTAIVILLVAGCAGWLGVMGYRYLRPKPGGKACAGGCGCENQEKSASASTAAGAGTGRTLMISSDDLRARVAARQK